MEGQEKKGKRMPWCYRARIDATAMSMWNILRYRTRYTCICNAREGHAEENGNKDFQKHNQTKIDERWFLETVVEPFWRSGKFFY